MKEVAATGSGGAEGLGGAIPIIGAGLQVLGAGFQIAQAIDARTKQKDAERAAAEATRQALNRLEVNRLQEVQVPVDAYAMAMREQTAQQMQSLEGLREADVRALIGGVGKLAFAGQAGVESQRQAMEDALYKRDTDIANEQSDIDADIASVNLSTAMGYQQQAADREAQYTKGLSSGMAGLGGAAMTYLQSRPLYQQRQGELGAAQRLQNEQGMYQGMNLREARRYMLQDYTPEQVQGFYNSNRIVLPSISSMSGLQPMGIPGLQPTMGISGPLNIQR
jgi:hypothetical protein